MLNLTHSNVNCQMSIEVCYCCLVQLFETPWTVVHQAPLSMGFSRQEYQGGPPCPPPGERPDPGINPVSPALAGRFFTTESVTRETPGEVRRHQFHLTDWYWYKIKTYCWWRRTDIPARCWQTCAWVFSHSVVSDALRPTEPWPARLPCSGDFSECWSG